MIETSGTVSEKIILEPALLRHIPTADAFGLPCFELPCLASLADESNDLFDEKKKQRYFVRLNRSLQFLIIESILMLILPDKKIHIFEGKELKIKVKNVFSIFFEMFEQSSKRHEERNLFFLPREREKKRKGRRFMNITFRKL